MLERFSSLRLDEEFQSHGIEPGHSWSPISELLLSIIAVYMQMIEETGIFIQDLKSQINDMVCVSATEISSVLALQCVFLMISRNS